MACLLAGWLGAAPFAERISFRQPDGTLGQPSQTPRTVTVTAKVEKTEKVMQDVAERLEEIGARPRTAR